MLCEDLAHATEQLNTLTEASKKHSGLLQSAQEELTQKEALIQELQHEVRQTQGQVSRRMGCVVVEVLASARRWSDSCPVGSYRPVAPMGSDVPGCSPAHPQPLT